mmetsp:Transcript_39/g.40  ORF Transcript_39/g.40 Transcript_39/m.40 type:complete len:92 (+) Transcript_39:74-349(+)
MKVFGSNESKDYYSGITKEYNGEENQVEGRPSKIVDLLNPTFDFFQGLDKECKEFVKKQTMKKIKLYGAYESKDEAHLSELSSAKSEKESK